MEQLEQQIGYRFKDSTLLDSALKHRSVIVATGETREDTNERLEFLGDAVLDLVVREELLEHFPRAREGQLTRYKSMQVSGRQLARLARQMELGLYLQISSGEDRSGGRNRSSILEDALEALIGAIYLDGGLPAAKRFIDRFVSRKIVPGQEPERDKNHKSLLLEYVQAQGMSHPTYRVASEEGPDHAKTFSVDVVVEERVYGSGEGHSKKQAEQSAAREALLQIKQSRMGASQDDTDK
jgi:ribonuclease III